MCAEQILSPQLDLTMNELTKQVCLQDPALLRLAAHQAARDEEVQAARRQVAELEAELGDAQRTLDLQTEQSAALKEVGRTRLSPASARCCPGSSLGCCLHSAAMVEASGRKPATAMCFAVDLTDSEEQLW